MTDFDTEFLQNLKITPTDFPDTEASRFRATAADEEAEKLIEEQNDFQNEVTEELVHVIREFLKFSDKRALEDLISRYT